MIVLVMQLRMSFCVCTFDPVVRCEIGTRIKRVSYKLMQGWPSLTAEHPLARLNSEN